MKQLLIYLLRWQCSTPILWIVISYFGISLETTIIANLLGGIIFFKIDNYIFLKVKG